MKTHSFLLLAMMCLHIVVLHFRMNYLQARLVIELQKIAEINQTLTDIIRKEAHKNK